VKLIKAVHIFDPYLILDTCRFPVSIERLKCRIPEMALTYCWSLLQILSYYYNDCWFTIMAVVTSEHLSCVGNDSKLQSVHCEWCVSGSIFYEKPPWFLWMQTVSDTSQQWGI